MSPPHLIEGEGDPECTFFTLNTYQATFIGDILRYDFRNRKLKSVTTKRWMQGHTDRHEG